MAKFIFILVFPIFFIGCKQSTDYINNNYKQSNFSFFVDKRYTDLDKAIIEISNQLLLNIPETTKKQNKIILSTFVNLNTLSQTSPYGRVISESLIDELHSRRFKIIDFRMQDVITVNQNGEFLLTRNIQKLKDEIPEGLIVVGTYSVIEENQVVLNARIMNPFTSDVISTAKVIYKFNNCKEFDICEENQKNKTPNPTKIKILEDK